MRFCKPHAFLDEGGIAFLVVKILVAVVIDKLIEFLGFADEPEVNDKRLYACRLGLGIRVCDAVLTGTDEKPEIDELLDIGAQNDLLTVVVSFLPLLLFAYATVKREAHKAMMRINTKALLIFFNVCSFLKRRGDQMDHASSCCFPVTSDNGNTIQNDDSLHCGIFQHDKNHRESFW
jgi:hypothetical protein